MCEMIFAACDEVKSEGNHREETCTKRTKKFAGVRDVLSPNSYFESRLMASSETCMDWDDYN